MAKSYTFKDKTGKDVTVDAVKNGWGSAAAGFGIGSAAAGLGMGDPLTGALWGAVAGHEDGYKVNNLFRRGTADQLNLLINFVSENGYYPSDAEIQEVLGGKVSAGAIRNLKNDLNTFIEKNNINISDGPEGVDPKQAAFNSYYNDLYSLEDGTLGKQMLDNLTTAEQNAALSNMQLADAQYQQAAMQQAEVVKNITDQVRAERMSRLRAGMNESQIANQDMQTMLSNMNALNQNMSTMNQNRLAAQQQYGLAQDTAYQQYLQNAQTMGQTAAAMAASDAGDAYMQTLKRMQQTGEKYKAANNYVTGGKS